MILEASSLGLDSIAQAIKKLEDRADQLAVGTVKGLRKLLSQIKKDELAQAQANAMQIG